MIRYKIDNIFFEDVEKQDITLVYGGDGIDADVGNVRLFNDARDLIKSYIATLDVFRDIPFEVYHDNEVIYSGYITFREYHNYADVCSYIEVSPVMNGKRTLEDYADSVTLLSVELPSVDVPYQLSSIPDNQAIAIALSSSFMTVYVLQEQLQALIEHITLTVSNPFTVNAALLIILRVSYIVLLIVALVKFLKDLLKAIIPEVKTCKAYKLKDAITVMLNKIGYSLSTNIFQEDLYIIPGRDTDGNIIDNSTLRDLLLLAKQYYNADISVSNNVVYIYNPVQVGNATVVIEDYVLIERSIDLSDCPSSILIRYSYDASDKNTVNNGVGNSLQALFERSGEAKIVNINAVRAKRKDELSKVEKILKGILEAADKIFNAIISLLNASINAINNVINLFNNIKRVLKKVGIKININISPIPKIDKVDLSAKIEGRIGNLLVEADTWDVAKLAVINQGKIAQDSKQVVNARYIYDNYYSKRYIYENVTIEISACYDVFKKIIQEKTILLDNFTYMVKEVTFTINKDKMQLKCKRVLGADAPPLKLIS